jgi:hypothetical protein
MNHRKMNSLSVSSSFTLTDISLLERKPKKKEGREIELLLKFNLTKLLISWLWVRVKLLREQNIISSSKEFCCVANFKVKETICNPH